MQIVLKILRQISLHLAHHQVLINLMMAQLPEDRLQSVTEIKE